MVNELLCKSCNGLGHELNDVDYPCMNCCGTGLRINLILPIIFKLPPNVNVHSSLHSKYKFYTSVYYLNSMFGKATTHENVSMLEAYESLLFNDTAPEQNTEQNLIKHKKIFVTKYSYIKLLIRKYAESPVPFNFVKCLINENSELRNEGIRLLLKKHNEDLLAKLLEGLVLDAKGKIHYPKHFKGVKHLQCYKCSGKGFLDYDRYSGDFLLEDCVFCQKSGINNSFLYDLVLAGIDNSHFKNFNRLDVVVNYSAGYFTVMTNVHNPDHDILDNPEEGLAAIKKFGNELSCFLKLISFLEWGTSRAFSWFPEHIKNNREIVLHAVKKNGHVLKFVTSELKSDKEIVLEAVKEDSNALGFASAELRANKNFVLLVVSQRGDALKYVLDELKSDKEVVLTAVKQNGRALEYASEELRNYYEVVLTAVKQDRTYGRALSYASKELKSNKAMVLEAINTNSLSFAYASEELKADKDVFILAVRKNGINLEWVPDQYKDDRDIVILALLSNVNAFKHASKRLQENKELQYFESLLHFKDNKLELTKQERLNVLNIVESLKDTQRKYLVIGDINKDLEEFNTAIENYKKSYEISPTGSSLFQIGKCYEKLQNNELAYNFFVEAAEVRKNRIGVNDYRTKEVVKDAIRISEMINCVDKNPKWFDEATEDDLPF